MAMALTGAACGLGMQMTTYSLLLSLVEKPINFEGLKAEATIALC